MTQLLGAPVVRDTTLLRYTQYTPWGQSDSSVASTFLALKDTLRLAWKGLMYEGDSTRLYYMRARWYDPQNGRFLSEDPIGIAGGSDLYAFGGNEPVLSLDPGGTCTYSRKSALSETWRTVWVGEGDEVTFTGASRPEYCGCDNRWYASRSELPKCESKGGGGAARTGRRTREAVSTKKSAECGLALAGLALTIAGDASFFVGAGAGIKLLLVGSRQVAVASMFARGAIQGAHLAAEGRFTQALGVGAIVGTAGAYWGPDALQQNLILGAKNWREWVPGFATVEAAKTAREACGET